MTISQPNDLASETLDVRPTTPTMGDKPNTWDICTSILPTPPAAEWINIDLFCFDPPMTVILLLVFVFVREFVASISLFIFLSILLSVLVLLLFTTNGKAPPRCNAYNAVNETAGTAAACANEIFLSGIFRNWLLGIRARVEYAPIIHQSMYIIICRFIYKCNDTKHQLRSRHKNWLGAPERSLGQYDQLEIKIAGCTTRSSSVPSTRATWYLRRRRGQTLTRRGRSCASWATPRGTWPRKSSTRWNR